MLRYNSNAMISKSLDISLHLSRHLILHPASPDHPFSSLQSPSWWSFRIVSARSPPPPSSGPLTLEKPSEVEEQIRTKSWWKLPIKTTVDVVKPHTLTRQGRRGGWGGSSTWWNCIPVRGGVRNPFLTPSASVPLYHSVHLPHYRSPIPPGVGASSRRTAPSAPDCYDPQVVVFGTWLHYLSYFIV